MARVDFNDKLITEPRRGRYAGSATESLKLYTRVDRQTVSHANCS